ncbi:MAG: hypothetical protein Q7S28_04325 [bacterium]|nr:hypothetical protein [bacterium]
MKKSGLALAAMFLAWAGLMLIANVSTATLPIQKKAKELGFPAANCQYCHVDKLPKKGASTNNERGKWLVAEKDKRGAKEVDPAWLKDYTGK